MNDSPHPPQAGTYQAGAGLIVAKLPDEVGVPVRRDQFEILCEGGIAESRASRDLCLGLLFGTVVGILGVMATADWNTVMAADHRSWFLLSMIVLIVMASGSAVGAIIFFLRCRRMATDSPYSRVRDKLLKLYEMEEPASDRLSERQIEFKPGLKVILARYGANETFADVTSILAQRIVASRLRIPVSNDLMPDLCPGTRKKLIVEYEYNGHRHTKTVEETETLSIP
jgi:hypothetical protein